MFTHWLMVYATFNFTLIKSSPSAIITCSVQTRSLAEFHKTKLRICQMAMEGSILAFNAFIERAIECCGHSNSRGIEATLAGCKQRSGRVSPFLRCLRTECDVGACRQGVGGMISVGLCVWWGIVITNISVYVFTIVLRTMDVITN